MSVCFLGLCMLSYLVAVLQRLHDRRHHQVGQHKLPHDHKAGEADGRDPVQVTQAAAVTRTTRPQRVLERREARRKRLEPR